MYIFVKKLTQTVEKDFFPFNITFSLACVMQSLIL